MFTLKGMQSLLKKQLDCSVVEPYGPGVGGCNSDGSGYTTDKYGHVFVKSNAKDGVRLHLVLQLLDEPSRDVCVKNGKYKVEKFNLKRWILPVGYLILVILLARLSFIVYFIFMSI